MHRVKIEKVSPPRPWDACSTFSNISKFDSDLLGIRYTSKLLYVFLIHVKSPTIAEFNLFFFLFQDLQPKICFHCSLKFG